MCRRGFGKGNAQEHPGDFFLEDFLYVYGEAFTTRALIRSIFHTVSPEIEKKTDVTYVHRNKK